MTREEKIGLLQDQVEHNRIDKQELYDKCKEWNLEWFDDVLSPIGYNVCDRCGEYGDSELGFLWVDGFCWEDENSRDTAILKAITEEGQDYCAVCWDCLDELAKKGGYNGIEA